MRMELTVHVELKDPDDRIEAEELVRELVYEAFYYGSTKYNTPEEADSLERLAIFGDRLAVLVEKVEEE